MVKIFGKAKFLSHFLYISFCVRILHYKEFNSHFSTCLLHKNLRAMSANNVTSEMHSELYDVTKLENSRMQFWVRRWKVSKFQEENNPDISLYMITTLHEISIDIHDSLEPKIQMILQQHYLCTALNSLDISRKQSKTTKK